MKKKKNIIITAVIIVLVAIIAIVLVKIHRAMEFLIRSDMTIAEIAAATGFSDSLYFSRQFRKFTGCSPRNYRLKDHGQRQEILGNLTFTKNQ